MGPSVGGMGTRLTLHARLYLPSVTSLSIYFYFIIVEMVANLGVPTTQGNILVKTCTTWRVRLRFPLIIYLPATIADFITHVVSFSDFRFKPVAT
jgi:hypothetical protein